MADPISGAGLSKEAWDLVKWLLVAAAGFFGFNLRRLAVKVDDHDKNHITRKEFQDTVREMHQDNREDFREVHTKLNTLIGKVGNGNSNHNNTQNGG